MIIAKLVDRKTAENIMEMKVNSLEDLKYRIVTIFREPESLLIMIEGMNPFLFVDFEHTLMDFHGSRVKYLCGDCGQSHTQESEAVNCCNQSEGSLLVTDCCEAEVIPMTIEEYPFDEYAACDKCRKSIE